ncbi:MAG: class I SAM-dependent methyltransferase [Alphaproteobacteria bacterium]|jgi:SAM-dependent methyltransferase
MKTWDEKELYRSQAFLYARYRTRYPETVFDFLAEAYCLGPNSTVFDLGCGTGQAAGPLAQRAGTVYALDAQAAMIEQGKRDFPAPNIRWVCRPAEEVRALGEPVDLTVMARSFHWMDRPRVLAELYEMTRPGGGVALLADYVLAPWHEDIREAARRFSGSGSRSWNVGRAGVYTLPSEKHEDILNASGFGKLRKEEFRWKKVFSADEIVGGLYTLSYCSFEILGGRKAAFEAEIRTLLKSWEPSGRFESEIRVDLLHTRKE